MKKNLDFLFYCLFLVLLYVIHYILVCFLLKLYFSDFWIYVIVVALTSFIISLIITLIRAENLIHWVLSFIISGFIVVHFEIVSTKGLDVLSVAMQFVIIFISELFGSALAIRIITARTSETENLNETNDEDNQSEHDTYT